MIFTVEFYYKTDNVLKQYRSESLDSCVTFIRDLLDHNTFCEGAEIWNSQSEKPTYVLNTVMQKRVNKYITLFENLEA